MRNWLASCSSSFAIDRKPGSNWSIPHVGRRQVGPENVVVQVRHRTIRRVPNHGFAEDVHLFTGVVISDPVKHLFGQEGLIGLVDLRGQVDLIGQVCEKIVRGFKVVRYPHLRTGRQIADFLPQVGELLELHRDGEPRVCCGDELPDVAEVDFGEDVLRAVAVLEDVDQRRAG
jgi:hypothetical protein